MSEIGFISKFEKNLASPKIFKLRQLSDQEKHNLLCDMLPTHKGKKIGKFIYRTLHVGIVDFNDRKINELSLAVVIELWSEVMQLNFRGGFYGRG